MRKLTVLLAILALGLFVAMPAWAVNEITNPSFDPGLNDWSVSANHASLDGYPTISDGTNHVYIAGLAGHASSEVEGSIYQIIDESAFEGWNAAGTYKTWTASVAYRVFGAAGGEVYAFYNSSLSDTAPVLPDPDDNAALAAAGWTALFRTDFEPGSADWATYENSGTVEGFQPRYVAFVLEGIVAAGDAANNYVEFDNVSFEGQCHAAVPVPPSALLFGSGLLGLVGFRFRNIFA